MIDTHSHPQFPQYDEDRDAVIRRAFNPPAGEASVRMICVGTDLEMSQRAVELAREYPEAIVGASIGLHPNDLEEEFDVAAFRDLARQNARLVVAIGEIGLDYYRLPVDDAGAPDAMRQQIQRERFEAQLDLASELDLPCIIHCRNAHEEMIKILQSRKDSGRAVTGVIHSFTGTWADAERYLELGIYIGLNGIITFPPSPKASDGHGARDYDETVIKTPLERILLETDAPYLTPIPHRGERNESSYLPFIAQKIAGLKGISFDEVAKQTTENAAKLFNLTG